MGKVGILSPQTPDMSWSDVLKAAALAEKLGYSSLSEGESWGQDAFTRLSWLASATSSIRIGTSIVPVYGRSPANLVMTALTLDWITQGRLFLGLGATGQLLVEAFHGGRFRKPVTRMREYIDVLRKALAHERLDYDGEFARLHHFQLRFEPERRDLPIFIGCQGSSSLQLTGECADGWLPIFFAPGRMDGLLKEIWTAAEAAGRSRSDIFISAQVSIYVTDDPRSARDRERSHLAFFIGAQGPSFHQQMVRIGFGDEADRIRAAFVAGDYARSCALVSDELIDAVTIIGTPHQCRDRLESFFGSGVEEVRLLFNAPSKTAFFQALEAVAPAM